MCFLPFSQPQYKTVMHPKLFHPSLYIFSNHLRRADTTQHSYAVCRLNCYFFLSIEKKNNNNNKKRANWKNGQTNYNKLTKAKQTNKKKKIVKT